MLCRYLRQFQLICLSHGGLSSCLEPNTFVSFLLEPLHSGRRRPKKIIVLAGANIRLLPQYTEPGIGCPLAKEMFLSRVKPFFGLSEIIQKLAQKLYPLCCARRRKNCLQTADTKLRLHYVTLKIFLKNLLRVCPCKT